MSVLRTYIKLASILALTVLALFTTSVVAQSSAIGANNTDKPTVVARDLS
jgi:hypothetical protein